MAKLEEMEKAATETARQLESLKTNMSSMHKDLESKGASPKKARGISPTRTEDDATKAKRKTLNEALIEQHAHGYTASGELQSAKEISPLLSVNAPLGGSHHMKIRLRGLNQKDYFPQRVTVDKMTVAHGEIWHLIWWLPKPAKTQNTVLLTTANKEQAVKVTQDIEQLHKLKFVNADLLITAARRRNECMKRIGVPWSAGFIAPHLRGAADSYTELLSFYACECPLDTLVAVDTALLEKRELGEWDFDTPIPDEEFRELLAKLSPEKSKCQFCAATGHTHSNCVAMGGTKELKQNPIATSNSVCKLYNCAAGSHKPCAGPHICGSRHACYACGNAGHPFMHCNKVKAVWDKTFSGYQASYQSAAAKTAAKTTKQTKDKNSGDS